MHTSARSQQGVRRVLGAAAALALVVASEKQWRTVAWTDEEIDAAAIDTTTVRG